MRFSYSIYPLSSVVWASHSFLLESKNKMWQFCHESALLCFELNIFSFGNPKEIVVILAWKCSFLLNCPCFPLGIHFMKNCSFFLWICTGNVPILAIFNAHISWWKFEYPWGGFRVMGGLKSITGGLKWTTTVTQGVPFALILGKNAFFLRPFYP